MYALCLHGPTRSEGEASCCTPSTSMRVSTRRLSDSSSSSWTQQLRVFFKRCSCRAHLLSVLQCCQSEWRSRVVVIETDKAEHAPSRRRAGGRAPPPTAQAAAHSKCITNRNIDFSLLDSYTAHGRECFLTWAANVDAGYDAGGRGDIKCEIQSKQRR